MRASRAVAAALVFALLVPASSSACPKTTVGEVEKEVMCPICGVPLALATEAPQAQRERSFIEREVARCRSKQEVKSALAAQFGDEVLALPGDSAGDEDDASDYLVYIVPALALLFAGVGIGFAVARWRGRRPAGAGSDPASTPPAGSDEDRDRLESDLDRYDL